MIMRSVYGWDKIIVTCSDNKQKAACERLLKSLDTDLSSVVTTVPDDVCNNRIGSGGSLFKVLSSYCSEGEKVLIINSGGASKRCINYATRGKAFARTCYKGQLKTLLEIIIEEYSKLFSLANSGAVVCCSDILVECDDVISDFSENIGFCNRTDFETGSRHGVMIKGEDDILLEFLHKRPAIELESKADTDYVLSDTGLVYFTDNFVSDLRNAEKKHNIVDTLKENGAELNLYPDIIPLLGKNKDCFYDKEDSAVQNKIKEILFKEISGSMKVYDLKDKPFCHFGTVSESLKNILQFSTAANKDYILINSFAEDTVIYDGTVIENSLLENCNIGKNCFISDVSLRDVTIPDNKLVCGFYTDDCFYVTVVCDVDENPKDKLDGTEISKIKRYYKGLTFTDSFNKYFNNSDEDKFSIDEVTASSNTDYTLYFSEYICERNKCVTSEKYLDVRNQILKNYFDSLATADSLVFANNQVIECLPVRVNLSGTWTDAMPYCIDNGGGVVNMAVTVNGKMPIEITLEKIEGNKIELVNDDKKRLISIAELDRDDLIDEFDEFRLHMSVLRMLGITAKTKIDSGFRFSIVVNGLMSGSGLGTSSILLGGCFRAFNNFLNLNYSDGDILSRVFVAEQLMKTGGGWQDQAGGLVKGIKFTKSKPGIPQIPEVISLDYKKDFLKGRIALVSTCQRHFGRFVVTDVMNRYINADDNSIKAFALLDALNKETIKSIESSDISSLCSCVNRHWEYLKMLSPLISDDNIDNMVEECRNIADAVSICGAGAGGYLFLIIKENADLSSFNYPVIPIELYD